MNLAAGVVTPRVVLVDKPSDDRGVAGPGGASYLRGALSGHSFLYPFRGLDIPYSLANFSAVQICRVPFVARVREFAYRFDVEDDGVYLFPIFSRYSGPRPGVVALPNGVPQDVTVLSSGDSDPSLGQLAFESQAALNYQRVPCGQVLPFFPCTLGLYVVNHAADGKGHVLSGWFSVEEILI